MSQVVTITGCNWQLREMSDGNPVLELLPMTYTSYPGLPTFGQMRALYRAWGKRRLTAAQKDQLAQLDRIGRFTAQPEYFWGRHSLL